jgi:cytoskeleton protein RodZ
MATDPFEKFSPASSAIDDPVVYDKQASPGTLLRVAREAAGLSVGDVATRLRMGVRQVDALERADYSALPTGTFLRGMVRNYAKLVHVDADAAIRVLEGTHTHAAVSLKDATIVVPSHNIKLSGGPSELTNPKVRAAIVGVVVLLLAAAAWYWWQYVRPNLSNGGRPVVTTPADDKSANKSVAPVENAAPGQPAPSIAATTEVQTLQPTILPTISSPANLSSPTQSTTPRATPLSTPPAATPPTAVVTPPPPTKATPATAIALAPAPAASTIAPIETTTTIAKESTNLKSDPNAVARPPGSSVLSFVCQGESWIEVVDGRGKALISRRFNAGESGEAIGRAPFSIVVGNAPQVKMTYNGNEFDLKPHTRIAVARVTLK